MRVTIVIPTYNERENLRPLVERIAEAFRRTPHENVGVGFTPAHEGGYKILPYNVEILIVDDASPDGTGTLADTLAREFPFVCVLHRARKEGLGAAYAAGFRRALTDGAEIVVQMDADGSHDPAEILAMLARLSPLSLRGAKGDGEVARSVIPSRAGGEGPPAIRARTPGLPRPDAVGARNDTQDTTDLVIGSRRVPGGRIIGWGLHRRFTSQAAQICARLLIGFRTRDITSGFRVWRANALRASLGAQNYESRIKNHGKDDFAPITSGYAFQEEMLYRAEQSDLRITEHPITFRDRTRGRSKLGFRDILGFFRTLARLWWRADEHRFALWLGVALVILTGAPYLYGWWHTPPEYTYTGLHALAPGDMAVYASYLEQVRDGRWTFINLFTSEWPQRPRLDIFWLAAGLFARATHLSAAVAFHALRLLLIIPFVLFLSTFVAAFLRSSVAGWSVRTMRRTALLLLAFASGVGAYLAPAFETRAFWRPGYEHWPLDLWVPESNTFLTLYQSPHLIVSLWLILYIILQILRFTETKSWKWSVAGGVGALLLFQFHPFYIPTIFAVLLGWIVAESLASRRIQWDAIRHAAIVAAIGAPSIIYHLWLLVFDPIMSAKAAQNLLFTPEWWLVAIGYGVLVPLAIIGTIALLRARTPQARLLLIWFIATIILIFSPLTWQRRLTEGLHVALAIIATFGLFALLSWLKPRLPASVLRFGWTRITALTAAIPLLGFSTIVNIGRDLALFARAFPYEVPRHSFYYPLPAVEAMRWIREHTEPGDVTFAVGIDGNFLPMYAARQSALGHGVETTNFVAKYHAAYALTDGVLTGSDARAFLERIRARYILVTDASRDLWRVDPATLPSVTLAYRNAGAEIYELTARTP